MNLIVLFAIIALAIQIYFSMTFAEIATKKGYNGATYGWLCFFFSVVGYCLVIALPDLNKEQAFESAINKLSQQNVKLQLTLDRIERMLNQQDAKSAQPDVEDTTPTPVEEKKATADATTPVVPLIGDDDTIVCPACNAKQGAGRKVCWSCGQKFVANETE